MGNSNLEVNPSLGEELSLLALEDGEDGIYPFEIGFGLTSKAL